MTRDLAIAWVRLNCPIRAMQQDVLRLLQAASASGLDWWFIVGRNLTTKKTPFLLQCFGEQVFHFGLTDRQAGALEVAPDHMQHGTSHHRLDPVAPRPQVTIERFQLHETRLRADQPILGAIDVVVDGYYPGQYAVRIDYALDATDCSAFAYPMQPLHGHQSIEVAFSPIGPRPGPLATGGRPLAIFAHVVQLQHPADRNLNQPLSHAAAALVETVGPATVDP